MENASLVPVILCGGAGTRLWPESRRSLPKQFLPLIGSESLFQATVARAAALAPDSDILFLTNEDMRFLVAQDISALQVKANIILEPVGRDTAPAIAVAALVAGQQNEDAVLVILPSDHFISPLKTFAEDIERAVIAAQAGSITVFGILPSHPSTAYGYIAAGEALSDAAGLQRVASFNEKPDVMTAGQFIAEGQMWNSGIFVARARDLIDAFALHAPSILEKAGEAIAHSKQDGAFLRLDEASYSKCEKRPFDIAVMEKTLSAAVLPARFTWSDIGAWDALWDIADKDEHGNSLHGDVVVEMAKNTLVRSTGRLTAVIGLDNIAVITTPDAVLVAPKNKMQDVKQLVARLDGEGRREVSEHMTTRRPWGSYETKDKGDRYHVKRITVAPGGRLSLQKHFHRSEHWVVVRGTARVTVNDTVLTLNENESTFIPIGAVHRLENPGKIPLELIEVQVGAYLEEDDIVRLDDQYGRDVERTSAKQGAQR